MLEEAVAEESLTEFISADHQAITELAAVPFVKGGQRVYDHATDTFERHAPAYLKQRLAAQPKE